MVFSVIVYIAEIMVFVVVFIYGHYDCWVIYN
jgi:hypothetical protein